jgi:hypothetical protein
LRETITLPGLRAPRVSEEGRSLTFFQSQRHVNFTNATPDELEQLAQACQPATFGRNDQAVMDETYRKAAKMDPDLFSTPLGYGHTDVAKDRARLPSPWS